MNAHRLEFSPPATEGLSRALVLAVLAHLLLVAALTLGVQWRRDAPTIDVQAELWSAVPQAAAPKLVEAPPAPPQASPTTAPAPVPTATPKAPDADIALEREKQRMQKEKLLAAQQAEQRQQNEMRRERERRDKEQLALEKKREQERQAALDKKQRDEQARLREEEKRRNLVQKAEQDAQKAKQQAARDKEQSAKLEADRQVNLQRMAGLAGASGAPGATGSALKASGSSNSYGGRVGAIVKANIVFTENPPDNPTALVEVRAAPDGSIVGRKLVKSSGNKAWDEAVLKAIDKTAVLPRDIDGTVPPVLEINFRRHD